MEKDLGYRSDYRFIGARLLPEHVEKLLRIQNRESIITTSKNRKILKELKIKFTNYPSLVPKFAFRLINDFCRLPDAIVASHKPPRSGIVILSLLLRYGCAKKITLYGFSLSEQGADIAISDGGNGIREYDLKKYANNHCHLSLEVYVLMKLLREGYVFSGENPYLFLDI